MYGLHNDQVRELYRRFPGVEAYIIRCSLKNEYRYLCVNEMILNSWQKNRLAELESLKRDGFCDFWQQEEA